MPSPVTILDKSTVLAGLFATWDGIDALLGGLTEQQWLLPTPLPGWCVRDVVAHMVGTESMLEGDDTPVADIDLSALEHVQNGVGELNEAWVRHLSPETGQSVLQRFQSITARRRNRLTEMSADEWDAPTPTPVGMDSYGRFMRVRVFDCWMHEHDIREAVNAPSTGSELNGTSAQLALDEIAGSMGYVVGKLGKAPTGSRVALELTGPLARTIRVDVAEKARVVDDFGGLEPTVTIRLGGLLFTRLAGGRTTDTDGVALDGDTSVGGQIVENLNFVI